MQTCQLGIQRTNLEILGHNIMTNPVVSSHGVVIQSGPLDIEIISQEFIVMLRQLSYAIKNQLKAPCTVH